MSSSLLPSSFFSVLPSTNINTSQNHSNHHNSQKMHLTINIDDVLESAVVFILLLILFNFLLILLCASFHGFLLLLPETMKQLRLIAAGEGAETKQEAEDIACSKLPDIVSDNKTMRVASGNDGNYVPTP
ncbi:unnamed protein product [Fusarium equiseti]|uniref:Uncharacterized protein n=1 Tax=Fusarium equiseti TaxID=61235 RepID=A0A8J2ILN6_FUSEQ|nr:unnamed protein product [Fusarium equiseti]